MDLLYPVQLMYVLSHCCSIEKVTPSAKLPKYELVTEHYLACVMSVFILYAGISSRVCNVPELLSRSQIRGSSGLHVPQTVVPNSLSHPEPSIRLHIRLDPTEAEGSRHTRYKWGRTSVATERIQGK